MKIIALRAAFDSSALKPVLIASTNFSALTFSLIESAKSAYDFSSSISA